MMSMPAPPAMSGMKKLSFAKVAASASKEGGPGHRKAGHTAAKSPLGPKAAAPLPNNVANPNKDMRSQAAQNATGAASRSATTDRSAESKVVQGLRDLKLEMKPPNLVVNGSSSTSTEQSSKTATSQTPSDDVSQKADSSSELGTKPPSLDGKSITSGTTFNVLDEKESLRPDDSASVKAAADEDDAFSIRGSLIANSRVGSDVAGRFRNIQIGDMPPRVVVAHALASPNVQGTMTPESTTSEQPPAANVTVPLATAPISQEVLSGNGFYSQNPDEKLLEAMKSQKDRLFLLRLENQVIEFVQDSKEPFMDLPPCNSFCRLLTHKLADYYHMTHSFEAVAGAVRIYRTPFCRVPPSLQSIAPASESTSSTPPLVMLPRKIMRRGEEGDSAPASAGASKATSEDGSDLKDKGGSANLKLTREEREEAYNKARLRIFGTTAQTENPSLDNEDSTGVSRASSVSAKDKSLANKRTKVTKQRRDDSEGFDSRSQYTPYYHPHQPMWAPQYVPVGNGSVQFTPQTQPQPAYAPTYGPVAAGQQYPLTMVPANNFAPQYSNQQSNPVPPAASQRFPPPPATQQMSGYTVPPVQVQQVPVQGTPPQSWQQPPFNGNQTPYQARATPVAPAMPPTMVMGPNGNPYPYGQLPVHSNPHDPKSQHPIPGSYNRLHAFNPKTQSFVPGTGMPPMPPGPPVPPVGPYIGPAQTQQAPGPIANAPPIPYGAPPVMSLPHHPPPYGPTGGGFGMMRQGSNNSLPPQYHHMPPHAQQPPVVAQHQHQHPHQQHPRQHVPPPHAVQPHPHQVHHQSPRVPTKPVLAQGSTSGPGFSHLPNYGNPATLPQKPST
ncbi:hypothetical protein RB598_004531 [Gaeumannomyces tritici]